MTVYGLVSETVKICLGKVLKKSLNWLKTNEANPETAQHSTQILRSHVISVNCGKTSVMTIMTLDKHIAMIQSVT